jgi:hypothetical protein
MDNGDGSTETVNSDGQRLMGNGQRAVADGQQSMGNSQWATADGQLRRTTATGYWQW